MKQSEIKEQTQLDSSPRWTTKGQERELHKQKNLSGDKKKIIQHDTGTRT